MEISSCALRSITEELEAEGITDVKVIIGTARRIDWRGLKPELMGSNYNNPGKK